MADNKQENIKQEYNVGKIGMDMDNSPNNIQKGKLTYALNAALENYDANGVQYQNEEGNVFVMDFPEGYILIGKRFISERNKHIFFLVKPDKSGSQIGYMDNNDGIYHVLINDADLNFDPNWPIHKIAYRITDCSTEIYWPDNNGRRYLDIDNIPKVLKSGTPLCSPIYEDDVDINQLKIESNFLIPQLSIEKVTTGGDLEAGSYQFAVQYSDAASNPYTSYYSVTNPVPIANPNITSVNFNYRVDKSIVVSIDNIDTTGQFKYFNLAVIKTINGISTAELVGTYFIDDGIKSITFTGKIDSSLSMNDIFEKYPYYDVAQDVTTAQDVLIWSDLTSIDRINYQSIANGIKLQWETHRIPPTEDYSNELNATNFRSYLRDEIYPFEIVFLLSNGKETDGFHIPGREKDISEKQKDDIPNTSSDFIGTPDYYEGDIGYSPYWKIYNTATVKGYSPGYSSDTDYKGPYQYGDFAYWESSEEYPCNTELWGELAGKKIRHHKFPDVLVSPIYEAKEFSGKDILEMGSTAIFPIGVKISSSQVQHLINTSNLTKEQKDEIVGFKIVRGDRSTNKSIVAKGMLRNVGKYTRDNNEYYFPNYPYNDLSEDPFLNATNNAFTQLCDVYDINIQTLGSNGTAKVTYTDCNTNKPATTSYTELGSYELCSTSKPIVEAPATGTTGVATYETWEVRNDKFWSGWRAGWEDPVEGYKEIYLCANNPAATCPNSRVVNVVVGTGGPKWVSGNTKESDAVITYIGLHTPASSCKVVQPLESVRSSSIKDRQVFNSPETSFGQPFLGSILKLENVIYGKGLAHFTEVKNNAKYKLISESAQVKAIESAQDMADDPFDATALFTAYNAIIERSLNSITKKNYAYSYNSIADYIYSGKIPNNQGIKQRNIDVSKYLIPGVQSINGDKVNNYQRESSVYIKTTNDIQFPDEVPNIPIQENSRFTISTNGNCNSPGKEEDINVVSYYASMKNEIVNQWGQIYSYDTIDTGYQKLFSDTTSSGSTVFGGDTFIGKFAFKTKLPFFIDNRVNAPDGSDIFYDEIGNVAYPKYWHSARSIMSDYTIKGVGTLSNIISYKAHNFDCPNIPNSYTEISSTGSYTTTTTTTQYSRLLSDLTYYDGYYYLFAYGVPSFYCESSYNLDLRQAFNNKEGEFWPHVSSGIPDDWVQETNVPIAQDNTYYYNTSFSKQNKENTFTHLPVDWNNVCYTKYPFRAIYSDPQYTGSDNRINNWRIYKATSYFDFPQNYGSLTSLDGIQNKAILARFENKTLLYNNLLTVDTSNPQAAYFGNPKLFEGAPPIDFADTDLGYVGCQNKMLLKIPQGQITVDAKRGQIFLVNGTQIVDLSAFGSGMNRFFTDHLAFEILKYFPDVDVDNNFYGIGLHGVFDSKYDRILITKLDYVPLSSDIKYDASLGKFYIDKTFDINKCNLAGIAEETIVPTNKLPRTTFASSTEEIREYIELTNTDYFCNKSWTVSYNLNTRSWISFHTYLPNWYIGENNFFYSGINNCCGELDFVVGISENTTTTTTSTSTSTTTTTSTTCAGSYSYSVFYYNCSTCSYINAGTICNEYTLTVGKWYYDAISGRTIYINKFNGCGCGTPTHSIQDWTKQNNCISSGCSEVTTTTSTSTSTTSTSSTTTTSTTSQPATSTTTTTTTTVDCGIEYTIDSVDFTPATTTSTTSTSSTTTTSTTISNLTNGLVSFYKFDEISGSTVTDYIGTNDLSIVGTLTLGEPGLLGTSYRFSSSYTNYVNGTHPLAGLSEFTIFGWMKPNTLNTWGRYWLSGSGYSSTEFITELYTTTSYEYIALYGSSQYNKNIGGILNDDTGNWVFIAFCGYTDGTYMFVKGAKDNNIDSSFTQWNISGTISSSIYIGRRRDSVSTNYNLDGWIDNMGFYNRVLSDSELSLLYNSGTPLDLSSL